MEEQLKYGFFDQFPISFFRPSKYKFLLSLKRRHRVGFIILISLLCFAMETLIPFLAWDMSVGGIENVVKNGIPEFTLENGVLKMDEPIELQMSGSLLVKADSGVEVYREKDLDGNYPSIILISKTNILLKNENMVYEIQFSKVNGTFNKESLLVFLPVARVIAVLSFIMAWIGKVIGYLISALFFAFICRTMARDTEGNPVDFRTAFTFAVYARAPFILISALNTALGNLGSSLWFLLIGVFLTMQYMLIAERSYFGQLRDRRRED